jgi:hypothetical protein
MKATFALSLICSMAAVHIAQGTPDNLVLNGSFETSPSGWSGTYGWLTAPSIALDGSKVGVVIDVGSSSVGQGLHQAIATVPGLHYSLSFSLLSGYGRVGEYPTPGNAPVNVYWGDQFLGVFSNPSTTIWELHQFELTASSVSTTIGFLDYSNMHWQLMDDVRVVVVPEPSAICIFGLALLGSALVGRRPMVIPA